MQLKHLITLSIFFTLTFSSTAQVIENWAAELNGSHAGQDITDIELDEHGNLYVIGDFIDTVRYFDTVIKTGKSPYYEGFLAKHSPDGQVQFIKQIGSYKISSVYISDIAIRGNAVYIVGVADSSLLTDKDTLYEIPNERYTDVHFIIKYDTLGNEIWVKEIISANAHLDKIQIDNEANIVITGNFSNWIVFGNDTVKTTSNLPFIQKLDSSGNYLWHTYFKGTRIGTTSLAIDDQNNVYCTGDYFHDSIIINGTQYSSDNFFVKYSSSGQFLWNKEFPYESVIFEMAYFDHKLHLNGASLNDFEVDNIEVKVKNGGSFFYGAVNENGKALFLDTLPNLESYKIEVNERGLYMLSRYETNFIFGNDTLFNPDYNDNFIVLKFSHDGFYNWVYQIPKDDYSAYANFIKVDTEGSIYFGGGFIRDLVFLNDTFKHYAFIGTAGIIVKVTDTTELQTGIVQIPWTSESQILVYPNPTAGLVQIKLEDTNTEDTPYLIYNEQGQIIKKGRTTENEGLINLIGYPSGVYYLELFSNTKKETIKIIKQ